MATINLSKLNDIIIPTNNGDTYRGNEGDDTYILVSQESSSSVSIIDTKGSNTIQLPESVSYTHLTLPTNREV